MKHNQRRSVKGDSQRAFCECCQSWDNVEQHCKCESQKKCTAKKPRLSHICPHPGCPTLFFWDVVTLACTQKMKSHMSWVFWWQFLYVLFTLYNQIPLFIHKTNLFTPSIPPVQWDAKHQKCDLLVGVGTNHYILCAQKPYWTPNLLWACGFDISSVITNFSWLAFLCNSEWELGKIHFNVQRENTINTLQ